MTAGHRVARFSVAGRATARSRAPWAKVLKKVDGTWVAYESEDDARDAGHFPLSNIAKEMLQGPAAAVEWSGGRPRKAHADKTVGPHRADRSAGFLTRDER